MVAHGAVAALHHVDERFTDDQGHLFHDTLVYHSESLARRRVGVMQLDPIHHDRGHAAVRAGAQPDRGPDHGRRAARAAPGCRPSGPSPRELGLAVNTVARVYKELEADGLVVTEGRRGTFVRSTHTGAAVDEVVAAYVEACRRQGLTRAEAVRLVEAGWSR